MKRTTQYTEEQLEKRIAQNIDQIIHDLEVFKKDYLLDSDYSRVQYLHISRACNEIVAEIDKMFDAVSDYDL